MISQKTNFVSNYSLLLYVGLGAKIEKDAAYTRFIVVRKIAVIGFFLLNDALALTPLLADLPCSILYYFLVQSRG